MHATVHCILLLLSHAMPLAEPSSKYEYFFHAWLFSEGLVCSRAELLGEQGRRGGVLLTVM